MVESTEPKMDILKVSMMVVKKAFQLVFWLDSKMDTLTAEKSVDSLVGWMAKKLVDLTALKMVVQKDGMMVA